MGARHVCEQLYVLDRYINPPYDNNYFGPTDQLRTDRDLAVKNEENDVKSNPIATFFPLK